MTPIQALVILLVIFAIGEIVADKTKALLSTTLVIAVVLLIGFWCGLPADIFSTAKIADISGVLIGLLITSMGTMIDFPELKRQWKTVIIGVGSVALGVAAIILVCSPIIGRNLAIAGAPIFAGANTATLVMTTALNEKGLTDIASFCVLMLVTQNFVGIPIASVLLRKEAKGFLKFPENLELYAKANEKTEAGVSRRPLQLPALFSKPSFVMVKLAVVAMISNFLAGLTQGTIHYFVAALLLGILFTELGFLDKNILSKTNAAGFIIFSTTMIIFTTLAQTTPGQLVSMIGPLLLSLGIGCVGVIIFGIVIGKALKVSPYLAISIGLTCTFGFPTTMLMSQEISSAIGSNDEEKAAILNYLMPKMITGGFITVTITSVLAAGVVVGML